MNISTAILSRAQGCLLGQLAGDALGSLVEFGRPEDIVEEYPDGVRELADGGYWDTIAGQPTDDSEMALMLARVLVKHRTYDAEATFEAYSYWFSTVPFDYGKTTCSAFHGNLDHGSQANGAMMRISPLGIFGSNFDLSEVEKWAQQDAAITHPNLICQQSNALFTMAIAHAIKYGTSQELLYQKICDWAENMSVESPLMDTIRLAKDTPPENYYHQMGWVLIAFRNALWQLLHAPNLEEGVIDTVMRGGDTDTNAAICGALLGAVYGLEAIPDQWREAVLNCRPEPSNPRGTKPRPECFWPVDALELAEQLVQGH